MKEAYREYNWYNAKKVNNIKNKDLVFKFDGHPINICYVELVVVSILVIVFLKMYYCYIYLAFFIIYVIYNKLSIYTVSFDSNYIIIKNYYKEHRIYYRNGIKIHIDEQRNFLGRYSFIKLITNKYDYKYSLIISDTYERFVLEIIIRDEMDMQTNNFINNFYYDDSANKEQSTIRFKNIVQ